MVKKKSTEKPFKLCSVECCTYPVSTRGFCRQHYEKWRRTHIDDIVRTEPLPECSKAGCDGVHVAKGFCRPHYNQWRRSYFKAKNKLALENW